MYIVCKNTHNASTYVYFEIVCIYSVHMVNITYMLSYIYIYCIYVYNVCIYIVYNIYIYMVCTTYIIEYVSNII